jgi:hypothetical protein
MSESTVKRPYRRPELEQVQLALDEAVLSGCKAVALAPGPEGAGADCEVGSGVQCFLIQT